MQQDQMLGASFPLTMEATPMPRTRQLMHNEGMMALNWFARRFSYPGSASIASIARMHGRLRAQVERRSVVRPVRYRRACLCANAGGGCGGAAHGCMRVRERLWRW
jgi:hypothetical protein